MATYKRWHGRDITADHPQWKRARWTVEFVLKGRRVIQPVPEARTQAQAEQAESQLREDIPSRRHSKEEWGKFRPPSFPHHAQVSARGCAWIN